MSIYFNYIDICDKDALLHYSELKRKLKKIVQRMDLFKKYLFYKIAKIDQMNLMGVFQKLYNKENTNKNMLVGIYDCYKQC